MRSSKPKTYSVISGEPQLGRTREWTVTYDKDDIIEAIITLFEEDEVSTKTEFKLDENYFEVGTVLSESNIFDITFELNMLLDDDWGTDKVANIVNVNLQDMIPNNYEIEIDAQEYL